MINSWRSCELFLDSCACTVWVYIFMGNDLCHPAILAKHIHERWVVRRSVYYKMHKDIQAGSPESSKVATLEWDPQLRVKSWTNVQAMHSCNIIWISPERFDSHPFCDGIKVRILMQQKGFPACANNYKVLLIVRSTNSNWGTEIKMINAKPSWE